jgi:transcriptional regulator with XRE-family HTH domain
MTFAGEVGVRLRMAREANKLTGTALAIRLGVSPQRLNNWETGDIVLPPEIAVAIFRELRIGPEYLYLGDDLRLPGDVRDYVRENSRKNGALG